MSDISNRARRMAIPLIVELMLEAERELQIVQIRHEVLTAMYKHAMKHGDASLEDVGRNRSRTKVLRELRKGG